MLKMIMASASNQAMYSAFRTWKYHNKGSPSPVRKLRVGMRNSSSGVKKYAVDEEGQENVELRKKIE